MYDPEYPSLVIFIQCLTVGWILLVSVAVCVLPGWCFARKMTQDAEINFLIGILLSLVIVHGTSMACYVLGWNHLVTGTVLSGFVFWSVFDIVTLRQTSPRFPWELVAMWLAVALLVAAAQVPIFVAGAPDGLWDWCEHWLKSLVLFEHQPLTANPGNLRMAARGPLMAEVAVVSYSLSGTSGYWAFQLVSGVVNTLAVVPWFILCHRLLGIRRSIAMVLAVFVPLVHADISGSAIFTWPKNMTAGLLLASLVIYGHGERTERASIQGLGLVGTSIAFLAHYLALPYALMLWLHYAIKHFRSDRHRRVGIQALLASAVIVSIWFVPCFYQIGVGESLQSNSTLGEYSTTEEKTDYAKVVVFNTFATLVPHSILETIGLSAWVPERVQNMQWYTLVTNDGSGFSNEVHPELELPGYASGIWSGFGDMGAGMVGIVLLCWIAGRTRLGLQEPLGLGKWFWVACMTLGFLANVATHKWYEVNGVSDSNLQIYTLGLLLILVALVRGLPPWPAFGITTVMAASGYAGLFKRIVIESHRLGPDLFIQPGERFYVWHLSNAKFKLDFHAVYLSDYIGGGAATLIATLLTLSVAALWLGVHGHDAPFVSAPQTMPIQEPVAALEPQQPSREKKRRG